jgi:hypothetical protein
VSEAQLKNRIDAFFEGLESRRIRKGRAAATEVLSASDVPGEARGVAGAPARDT